METLAEYPLITIGIPTYNGSSRILNSIDSIKIQDYPNIQVIISDNCSTDNTSAVVKEVLKTVPGIVYYRQKTNIGLVKNFDFLLQKATGKYFMWLSDDDCLEPGVLSKYVSFMEQNSDYSVVTGNVKFWLENKPDMTERGFTFEQKSPGIRVFRFYLTVIYCGLIHGMMRIEFGQRIALRKVIGNDYHFVANLVYLGKIKNFDFIGYNKNFGGTSKNFHQYAKSIGESKLTGYFPHIKIACDAFAEVMYNSRVFEKRSSISRFALAVSCFFALLYSHYITILVVSRIKNFIQNPLYVFQK